MFGKDNKEEFHEKILYEAQPNIFVYSKGILISMFVLGFLFFLYSAGISFIGNMNVYLIETTKVPITRYFAIAIFILIMVVIAYIIIKLLIWTSIKYTITENRVIVEKGILLQKQNSMPFNTIQDVSRSQSLLGKIFSVGTITLYSAYDGKDLELSDVSSPKKVENIIFENMRGTHLRRNNLYDDNFDNGSFNPIRPNSDEPIHYRRMEDLDDLELIDAKERKRQLREIRRQAKNSRNNPNSNYGPTDDYYRPNDNYYDYYGPEDDYYDDYYDGHSRGRYDSYPDNRAYPYDERAFRDNYNDRGPGAYGNNQYDSRMRRPDSHHHQYSGAIKESYSRNPDKYFANNYEEFHQNNLDAQRDYDDYVQGRAPYPNQNQEPPKEEKKSKGLSRFNPFSSNKDDEVDRNISDEEFDSTINQAMQDMGDNIKFKPSNNNQFRDNQNPRYDQSRGYGRDYGRDYNRGYDRGYDRRYDDRAYDNRSYDDYNRNYHDSRHSMNNYQDSRHLRDNSNAYNHNNHYNDANPSRNYSNDSGEIDYKYKSPRESRKSNRRNSNSYNANKPSNQDLNNKDGNKNSDDPFEKHSRKFKR